MTNREHIDTIVIGAGQSGLSVGYHLKRRGVPFVILEENAHIGDNWRKRWDSLRLFTPARYDGLDGMPFPASKQSFPTKNEMAAFLESYAKRFDLPIRTGVRVERLAREGGHFVIDAGEQQFEADNVVVAMATFQRPRVPHFAPELDTRIVQLHSSAYQNPGQLQKGTTLVVGGGNSGAEIALELARLGPQTILAGNPVGHVPFRIERAFAQLVLVPLVFRFVFHRVLTVDTPMGRRARPKALVRGAPLVRVKPRDLTDAGVERVARVAGVQDGKPLLEDGRVLDVANVIWCTGFHPGFKWIDLPIFDDRWEPAHERGIVASQPGLYFVGLHFLYALSSTMIHGVGRDAERIANHIAAGRREVAISG